MQQGRRDTTGDPKPDEMGSHKKRLADVVFEPLTNRDPATGPTPRQLYPPDRTRHRKEGFRGSYARHQPVDPDGERGVLLGQTPLVMGGQG